MSRIRILQFITPAGFYGAERWVLALANNVDPGRMLCDLAVTEEGAEQDLSVADQYPARAGRVHRLKMQGRFDWNVIRKLEEVIRHRRIEVIHTHGYKSDILGLIAARRTGIKCVSTPHGFSGKVGWKLGTFIRLGIFALRFFDGVAPLSSELMNDMQRFKVPSDRLRMIRNGVDLLEIQPHMLSQNEVGDRRQNKRIGYIGQMIPRKGLPDLLDAFDKIYNTDSTLRLILVGDGPQRAELEGLARTLRGGEAIEFLGYRADRLALLSSFDLFVMTSSLEGIPRCLMEAMAVGVPCVAYNIPGVDKLIEDQVTGRLVEWGDTVSLASACMEILENPAIGEVLAQNARRQVESLYSARRMAEEYDTFFRELLGGKRWQSSKSRRVG